MVLEQSHCETLGRRAFTVNAVRGCSPIMTLIGAPTVLQLRGAGVMHSHWELHSSCVTRSVQSPVLRPAWGNLGNVLKNQGRTEEAEKAYLNALYFRRNMADMLYNL